MTVDAGPLIFLHIPKTGGTSLIRTLRQFVRRGDAYTEIGNNLSQDFAQRLSETALSTSAFVHGHPGPGASLPFRGKARFITLLREPRQQTISHYLHAINDPAMPQHAAARELGFKRFLRTYRYIIPFQTNCLYQAATDPGEERRRALHDPAYGSAFALERYFARQLDTVFSFLDEMLLVGTLENIEPFLACLSEFEGWNHVPAFPHENAAAAEAADQHEQLYELEREPELSTLFAIERATYNKASSLLRAAMARRLRARTKPSRTGIGGSAAHHSTFGEIHLSENFRAAEPAADWWDRSAPAPNRWWTGNRQVSRLCVETDHTGPLQLTISADRLHFVTPAEVALCLGERWLTVDHAANADGSVLFSTRLGDGSGDRRREVLLYLEWNRYPGTPPFYPAIRFNEFSLRGIGAAS